MTVILCWQAAERAKSPVYVIVPSVRPARAGIVYAVARCPCTRPAWCVGEYARDGACRREAVCARFTAEPPPPLANARRGAAPFFLLLPSFKKRAKPVLCALPGRAEEPRRRLLPGEAMSFRSSPAARTSQPNPAAHVASMHRTRLSRRPFISAVRNRTPQTRRHVRSHRRQGRATASNARQRYGAAPDAMEACDARYGQPQRGRR